MSYQEKRNWLQVTSWRISGELMKMNPIDRLGLLAELQRENEAALKKRVFRMSAWNFKKHFVPLILDGSKETTIRRARKDGRDPKEGETVSLFSGMRTKQCEAIGTCLVERRHAIEIRPELRIVRGDWLCNAVFDFEAKTAEVKYADLSAEAIKSIALLDGFKTVDEFWAFFREDLDGYLFGFCLSKAQC